MIAITGATGQLGRLVVEKLKAGVPASDIVALARSTTKAAGLGVTAREADYDKPETLEHALDGVDTLLLISSSEVGKRATQHHNVIEAAKRAGVKRIVYTSLLHADSSPLDLAEEHLATEAELKASGVPFTILRNGWYTENYTGSIPGALAGGGAPRQCGRWQGLVGDARRLRRCSGRGADERRARGPDLRTRRRRGLDSSRPCRRNLRAGRQGDSL